MENKSTTGKKAVIVVATVLLAIVGGVASMPAASAHECHATVAATSCGPCTAGEHNHSGLLGCWSRQTELSQ